MSNFGTGQNIFGAAANQNKDQNPSNSGSTPAASGGGLFGNLGANTTSSSAFGGSGAGGAPAASSGLSGPGTSGGFSGAGGGLFGGGGNANANAPNPAGAGANASPFGFPKPPNAGGGLFGSGATGPSSTNASGPTGGGIMGGGGGPSLFSGLGSQPKASDAPAPSASPFGQLPGGSLFAAKTPGTGTPATTTTTNTQPQPAFSLGGTTLTGDKTAPAAAPAAGGGLFAGFGATANKNGKPEEKKDGAPAPTLPAFSLGGQPASTTAASTAPTAEKKDGAAPPSLFSGLGSTTTGATKPATPLAGPPITAPGLGTTAMSTTSAISVPAPSMLKGKSIEEIVNRWSTELELHVRDFNKFAAEVVVWDRSLIENGNNLAALYNYVLAAEREQNDIDQSLEHIEQQEKELTAIVETYEKQMADILGGQGGNLRALDTGPADSERDKNYMLATELHNHLDDLSSSLTQLIESVNSMSVGQSNTKPTSAEDPMAQIAQVLSNHLESLQWIDGASRDLEEKVTEVEKRIKDVSGVPHGTPVPGGSSRSRGFGLTR